MESFVSSHICLIKFAVLKTVLISLAGMSSGEMEIRDDGDDRLPAKNQTSMTNCNSEFW